MLTEKDYCDYETCVALKELGFREKCLTYYDTEDNVGLLYNTQWALPCQFTDCLESHNSNTSDDNSYIDAPNLHEAQKWLREEKGINMFVVQIQIENSNKIIYQAYIQISDKTMLCPCSHSFEEALSEGIKEAVKILKEK